MMTREELESDIRDVMNESYGLGRRMGACQRIYDHDQAQRAVIEQQADEISGLKSRLVDC